MMAMKSGLRVLCWVVVLLCGGGGLLAQQAVEQKPEAFLLLPEPRLMMSARSLVIGDARDTVFSPAREVSVSPFVQPYGAAAMKDLGISPESFAERAMAAADRLLAGLTPEWIRGADGAVQYAVYRGERPIFASLLVAPSLPLLFEKAFGEEIWLAAPDRHALYVFPAKPELVIQFGPDLMLRFEDNPYSASSEIFSWKKGQKHPLVIGSFGD
jgi:hypothetical protein